MKLNTKELFENESKVKSYLEKYATYKTALEKEIELMKANLEKDCINIDETNLVTECNKCVQLYNKYSMIYADKKPFLNRLNRNLDEIQSYLFDYYMFNYDKSTKMTVSLADKYIKSHCMYKEISEIYENYSNYLQLIERTLEYCRNRGYAVKNIIEIQKIKFGMN